LLFDAMTGELIRRLTQIHSALNRQSYDANSTTSDPGMLVRVEGAAPSGIADADNAYTFFGDTYNFYLTHHGRDSINGFGSPLSATVRYCSPSASGPVCPPPGLAFYNQNNGRMYFGTNFVSDDVTAHELTHGVTAMESQLLYQNASGAINESFSDIW